MQFDVFHNQNKDTNRLIPYLLDLQANLLDGLATRVVAPLILSSHGKAIKHLHPVFTVENKKVILLANELAGVPIALLGEKVVSLSSHRQEIISALDFLFTGF